MHAPTPSGVALTLPTIACPPSATRTCWTVIFCSPLERYPFNADICATKVLVNLLNARSALSCCGMFQGLGDDSVMAFTDFGVESLVELIKIHRESTPTRER